MRFFNFDLNEARFEAFFGEIWFFALFSLIWPLEWLSEPNLELLFLEWSLALDPTPFVALGSATSQGLGWKCLIFVGARMEALDFLMTPPPNH